MLTDSCQAGALANALPRDAGSAGGQQPLGGRGLTVESDLVLPPSGLQDRTKLWLVLGAGTASDNAEEGEKYKLPTDPEGVKGHGVFTWALLQALASRQADTDQSGTLTLSELLQHVNRAVSEATQQRQLPVTSGRFMEVAIGFVPGSVELCDGKDNDLNGSIDEGFDSDHNGKGDCLQSEVCNGRDDNGNGLVDEGFDADGDGYPSRDKCGSVIGTDCNDRELTLHPHQEDWGNLRDDDCDGLTDEDDFDHNRDQTPDVPGKRLQLIRSVQLGGLGLSLGFLGSSLLVQQRLSALEQLPTGDAPEPYSSSPDQLLQYRQLFRARTALGTAGTLSLGMSLGFTFYGHELRGRLPKPWTSPHEKTVPPVSTPASTPMSTPASTPASTPMSTPASTPASTPMSTPASTPAPTSTSTAAPSASAPADGTTGTSSEGGL